MPAANVIYRTGVAPSANIEQAWGVNLPRDVPEDRHFFIGGHELVMFRINLQKQKWRVCLNDTSVFDGPLHEAEDFLQTLANALGAGSKLNKE